MDGDDSTADGEYCGWAYKAAPKLDDADKQSNVGRTIRRAATAFFSMFQAKAALKKRFFVLDGNELRYYRDERRTQFCGVIDLSTVTDIRWSEKQPAARSIELITDARTFYISPIPSVHTTKAPATVADAKPGHVEGAAGVDSVRSSRKAAQLAGVSVAPTSPYTSSTATFASQATRGGPRMDKDALAHQRSEEAEEALAAAQSAACQEWFGRLEGKLEASKRRGMLAKSLRAKSMGGKGVGVGMGGAATGQQVQPAQGRMKGHVGAPQQGVRRKEFPLYLSHEFCRLQFEAILNTGAQLTVASGGAARTSSLQNLLQTLPAMTALASSTAARFNVDLIHSIFLGEASANRINELLVSVAGAETDAIGSRNAAINRNAASMDSAVLTWTSPAGDNAVRSGRRGSMAYALPDFAQPLWRSKAEDVQGSKRDRAQTTSKRISTRSRPILSRRYSRLKGPTTTPASAADRSANHERRRNTRVISRWEEISGNVPRWGTSMCDAHRLAHSPIFSHVVGLGPGQDEFLRGVQDDPSLGTDAAIISAAARQYAIALLTSARRVKKVAEAPHEAGKSGKKSPSIDVEAVDDDDDDDDEDDDQYNSVQDIFRRLGREDHDIDRNPGKKTAASLRDALLANRLDGDAGAECSFRVGRGPEEDLFFALTHEERSALALLHSQRILLKNFHWDIETGFDDIQGTYRDDMLRDVQTGHFLLRKVQPVAVKQAQPTVGTNSAELPDEQIVMHDIVEQVHSHAARSEPEGTIVRTDAIRQACCLPSARMRARNWEPMAAFPVRARMQRTARMESMMSRRCRVSALQFRGRMDADSLPPACAPLDFQQDAAPSIRVIKQTILDYGAPENCILDCSGMPVAGRNDAVAAPPTSDQHRSSTRELVVAGRQTVPPHVRGIRAILTASSIWTVPRAALHLQTIMKKFVPTASRVRGTLYGLQSDEVINGFEDPRITLQLPSRATGLEVGLGTDDICLDPFVDADADVNDKLEAALSHFKLHVCAPGTVLYKAEEPFGEHPSTNVAARPLLGDRRSLYVVLQGRVRVHTAPLPGSDPLATNGTRGWRSLKRFITTQAMFKRPKGVADTERSVDDVDAWTGSSTSIVCMGMTTRATVGHDTTDHASIFVEVNAIAAPIVLGVDALLQGSSHRSTVLIAEPSIVLELRPSAFCKLIQRVPRCASLLLAMQPFASPETLLGCIPCMVSAFADTSSKAVCGRERHQLSSALAAVFRPIVLNIGEPLFVEDDVGDCAYVVIHGEVGLSVYSATVGAHVLLSVRKRGSCIGESALIVPGARTYRALALTSCLLLRISHDSLRSVLAAKPRTWRSMRNAVIWRDHSQLIRLPVLSAIVGGEGESYRLAPLTDLFSPVVLCEEEREVLPGVISGGVSDVPIQKTQRFLCGGATQGLFIMAHGAATILPHHAARADEHFAHLIADLETESTAFPEQTIVPGDWIGGSSLFKSHHEAEHAVITNSVSDDRDAASVLLVLSRQLLTLFIATLPTGTKRLKLWKTGSAASVAHTSQQRASQVDTMLMNDLVSSYRSASKKIIVPKQARK